MDALRSVTAPSKFCLLSLSQRGNQPEKSLHVSSGADTVHPLDSQFMAAADETANTPSRSVISLACSSWHHEWNDIVPHPKPDGARIFALPYRRLA